MTESTDPGRSANLSDGEGTSAANPGGETRREEATSSETLADIERSEKTGGASSSSSGSDSGGGSLEGSSPNPSGEGGSGRADGSDTGGPM
ncbi:MAG TPA: hypothetical protein VF754_04900 [Pyrinomonadaceae bacterium]